MKENEKDEILYIDDLDANLEIFNLAFKRFYNIHLATSGIQGLEILRSNNIKVLITDQRMPTMTGVEFLIKISAEFPDLPRIVLTAYADVDEILDAINKGNVYRYMLKPWKLDDLRQTIDSAIETFKLKNQNKKLINDLLSLNKQLEEINLSLEQKVIERTKKIEEQNKEIISKSEYLKETNEKLKTTTEELAVKNEKLSEAYDNLQILSETGKKIISSLDLQTIIENVYINISKIIQTDVFSIGIFDNATKRLTFPITKENNQIIQAFDLKKDENKLAEICFNSQKHIFISNFSEEYSKYFDILEINDKGEIMESIIYIPIISKNKIMGTLTVQAREKNVYNDFHLNFLKNIAVYTSIALENSETYTHIEKQKQIIELKNENINAGLRYAQNIQNAILPKLDFLDNYFEHFLFYLPLEIVSGDFYWFNKIKNTEKEMFHVSVIDCTGHGVSGAFMSLIGNRLLEEIVYEKNIVKPSQILDELDFKLKKALNYEQTDINDGMDMCLCLFEKIENKKYKVTFSGAKRPIYHYKHSENELEIIRGDRKSIGGFQMQTSLLNFTDQEIIMNCQDVLYLSTDGYIDQNNSKRKKIGTPGLTRLIKKVAKLSMQEQNEHLLKNFFDFKKEEAQRDDITILGIKNKNL